MYFRFAYSGQAKAMRIGRMLRMTGQERNLISSIVLLFRPVMSVSVRLSDGSHISETKRPSFSLYVLSVTVAQPSSDGPVIRHVLPVLKMTSCFRTVDPTKRRKRA